MNGFCLKVHTHTFLYAEKVIILCAFRVFRYAEYISTFLLASQGHKECPKIGFNLYVIYLLFYLRTEEPRGTNDLCPRLNGFYAHPEPSVCNVFYACVDGVAEEYTSSPGLYFDEYKGVCNWPVDSDRTNCKAGKYRKNIFMSFLSYITYY